MIQFSFFNFQFSKKWVLLPCRFTPRNYTQEQGFTLIELLVVISLTAILTSVTIVSFSSYNKGRTVQSAAQDFASYNSAARSRAVSQIKPAQCTNQSLDGYKIVSYAQSQTYEMHVQCNGIDYVLGKKLLPTGVLFTSSVTTTTFFAVSTGIPRNITSVGISGNGKTAIVAVDASGNISVK